MPSTTRPAAHRDSPTAHRATQGSQPALRISSTDPMLPLPHCQCVQKATPRLRICNSRTRRYAIPADPVAETSESLSPIFRLKPVDHIYSFGSGHRIPGPRIALRVARRMSCTQCRVIMVICPGFQRRLQMCHGTKTGLLVGWVVSSSVEPVLTYCWHKIHIHSRFLLPFSGGRPAQCNSSSLTLDAGQAMLPTHIRPSCNTPKRRSRRSWTEA